MPICPSCKTFFPPGVPACPKDGTSLLSKAAPPAPLTGARIPIPEVLKAPEPSPQNLESQDEDDHTPNEEPAMSTMRMEALELELSSHAEMVAQDVDEPTPTDASAPELELVEESSTPSEGFLAEPEDAPEVSEPPAPIEAAHEPAVEIRAPEPEVEIEASPAKPWLEASAPPPPPPIGVAVAEMRHDEEAGTSRFNPMFAAPEEEDEAEAPKPLPMAMPLGLSPLPFPASIMALSSPAPAPFSNHNPTPSITPPPVPPPAPVPLSNLSPTPIPSTPPPLPFSNTPPPIPLAGISSPPPIPLSNIPAAPPPLPFSAPPIPKKAEPPAPVLAESKPDTKPEVAPVIAHTTPPEGTPEVKPSAPPGRPMAPPGRPSAPPGYNSAKTPPEGTPVAPRAAQATPPEGTPAMNHSMRTPPEGSAVVGDGGGRPMGPPGRPMGRPAPAPLPAKAPLPMRAAPLPPRPQKSEDANSTSKMTPIGVASAPKPPPPKPDFQFPQPKNAPFPEINIEWTIRVQSDAQEPGSIVAAAGTEDVALCWHDRRQKKRYEVFAARFGQKSQKRGPAVSIVPKPGPALNPAIAWDGAGYGLFWQDGRKNNADIYYRHLDKEGKPDGKELRLTDGKAESMNPKVIWNGNEFACVYAKQIGDVCEIYLMRVKRDGSLIGEEQRVSEGNRNALNPSIVFTGDSYGIAWEDFRNDRGHVYFCRLAPDGGRFCYDQRVSIGKTGASNAPSIAHNGDNFAVAWVEWPDDMRQNNAIHFAKINNRGQLIGEIHRVITEKAIQAPATLLWRDSEYVVVWQDSREGSPQIFAQRVDPDGVRVGGEVRLSNGEGAALYAWAVPGPNNQVAAAWHNETQESGVYEIFGSMLSLPPLG